MNRFELVIFDCDGVLVDSEILCHQVLMQMIAEHGVVLTLEEALGHFMGTSNESCLAAVSAVVGRPMPEDFMAQFAERTIAAFGESLMPVPGIEGVLQSLSWPFCVASNGPREKMGFTLGHTGLLPHFEGRIFSAQDVERPKPAPDLFLHAARSCGVDAAKCVVIEDSPTGVKAARAAGMTVVGYAAMGHAEKLLAAGAHAVFSAMANLPELLASMHQQAGGEIAAAQA